MTGNGRPPEPQGPTLKEMIDSLPWFGGVILTMLGILLILALIFCAVFLGIQAWNALVWAV